MRTICASPQSGCCTLLKAPAWSLLATTGPLLLPCRPRCLPLGSPAGLCCYSICVIACRSSRPFPCYPFFWRTCCSSAPKSAAPASTPLLAAAPTSSPSLVFLMKPLLLPAPSAAAPCSMPPFPPFPPLTAPSTFPPLLLRPLPGDEGQPRCTISTATNGKLWLVPGAALLAA
jgi:hypothetical protein